MNACVSGESDIWVVERDMPQTRNLVPILNRTTLVAAGPGRAVRLSLTMNLKEIMVRVGPFWPRFGNLARMGVPVLIPDDFPCREPRILEAPEIITTGDEARLEWPSFELKEGEGVAAHSDTWLGPPDMYHTEQGLRFGDIQVVTDYRARLEGKDSLVLSCRLVITNKHSEPAEAFDFSFFFPRAVLDKETGAEIPLLRSFAYTSEGFSEPNPLDLLISDGLGRGAWGPRFTVMRERLEPGGQLVCSVEVKGTISDDEALIVPLVSLMARLQARYWPSSEVEAVPSAKFHSSAYTHFNLVVADSRLFRLKKGKAEVLSSSPFVRARLNSAPKPSK